MSRLTVVCTWCKAEVYPDFHRNRLLEEDGARHSCPMPDPGTILECACGTIVTVQDGVRRTYRTGTIHTHEAQRVPTPVPTPRPQSTGADRPIWEVYTE